MTHIGQQDAEQTLSEIHEREQRMFEAQMEHQSSIVTNILADAGKDFAKSEVYKALGYAVYVATCIGGLLGARQVIRRW